MTELFEQLDLASRAHELTRLVNDAALADTRKPFDDEYAQHARELVAAYIEGRPEAIRAELRESEGANRR